MEVEKILDAGSAILEDVMTAVETNQYQDLGKRIQDRVSEATKDIGGNRQSGYSAGSRQSSQSGQSTASRSDGKVYTGTVEPTNRRDGVFQTNFAEGGGARQTTRSGSYQQGAFSGNGYRRYSSDRRSGPTRPNSSQTTRQNNGYQGNQNRAGYQKVYGNRPGQPGGPAAGAYQKPPVQGKPFFAPTPFNSKNISRNTGVVPMVFGSIGMVMGGIGTLMTGAVMISAAVAAGISVLASSVAAPIMGGMIFTGASGVLFSSGKKKKDTVDEYYRYGKYVGNAEFFNIRDLAQKLGVQEKKLRKNLQKMMDQGLLPKARMDDNREMLLLTDKAYDQYRQAADSYKKRQEEDEKRENYFVSGNVDATVKQLLSEGNEYLKKVRYYNDLIPDTQEMSNKLYRLENIMYRIFEQVKKKPSEAPSLRKFMEYYLPTTEKLLSAYIEVDKQPQVGDNIKTTKEEIESALDIINDAFEKLLDGLFEDLAWDISSDISVMKTMLQQDGLT
ncbi:MAG: 5-bromo-4-chloroindolyl phosphate hydrolysis family protein [Lachnospiraceae bacterium]|nr:5-bromo-4-chloroindolyl phosphate hydrolysis family protein [Lachnospiraceae bacterium]